MLLIALQTTTATAHPLDAFTLVLVVVFIISMAVLSVLIYRRNADDRLDSPTVEHISPPAEQPSVAPLPRARFDSSPPPTDAVIPVWLEGVVFPSVDVSLTEAVRIIELLLIARRDHDLLQGIQFYTSDYLRSFQTTFGIDNSNLEQLLTQVDYTGSPPTLRLVELIDTTGNRMKIRAEYTSNGQEIYHFVYIDNRWFIDQIDRTRQ